MSSEIGNYTESSHFTPTEKDEAQTATIPVELSELPTTQKCEPSQQIEWLNQDFIDFGEPESSKSPAAEALDKATSTTDKMTRKTMDGALDPTYKALFEDRKSTTLDTLRELTERLPKFADKLSTATGEEVKYGNGVAHSLTALAFREIAKRTDDGAEKKGATKDANRSTERALAVSDDRVPTLNYAFQHSLSDYMEDRSVDSKNYEKTVKRIEDLASKAVDRDQSLDINNPSFPLLARLADGIKGQEGANKKAAEDAYKKLAEKIEAKIKNEQPEDRSFFYSKLRALAFGLDRNDEVKRLTELMKDK